MKNEFTSLVIFAIAAALMTSCKPKTPKNGSPTPSPAPGPTAAPTPTPASNTCAVNPAPRLIKLQPSDYGNRPNGDVVLNVTPKIWDETQQYCRLAWPTIPSRWGKTCAMGPENYQEILCQREVVGVNPIEDRMGPKWTIEPLSAGSPGTVRGTPNNPYLGWVTYPGGRVTACGNIPDPATGLVTCGSIDVTPGMFGPPQ